MIRRNSNAVYDFTITANIETYSVHFLASGAEIIRERHQVTFPILALDESEAHTMATQQIRRLLPEWRILSMETVK